LNGAPPQSVAVERAADELRHGRSIVLTGDAAGPGAATPSIAVQALELTHQESLDTLDAAGPGPALLAITGRRAAFLKLGKPAYQASVVLARPTGMLLGDMLAAADPVGDLNHPFKGPFQAMTLDPAQQTLVDAAIELAKRARLLPAVLVRLDAGAPHWAVRVAAGAVLAHGRDAALQLRPVAAARVPLLSAEQAQVHAFSAGDGGIEHLAIVIGDPSRHEPVLARIHSECFTGDLLGSLKCDCGPQLRGALDALARAGGGVLLYMAQEGRGIGLINKLRAYQLQDQGFDTVDANLRLGFEIDERSFEPAAQMLRLLGFSAVRLMTNNPEKLAGLAACGIEVVERVAHRFPANTHNALYLATKRTRTGHLE